MNQTDPTPFGKERATEIWNSRGYQWSLTLTPGENAYVKQVWNGMAGNTCWMDAFFRILRGKVPS